MKVGNILANDSLSVHNSSTREKRGKNIGDEGFSNLEDGCGSSMLLDF